METKKRTITEEHKQKIREGTIKYNKERVLSPETLVKMSESAKKERAENPRPLPKGMHVRKEHVFVDGVESKECYKCSTVKPLSAFGKNKHAKWDGLTYECRECRNAMIKERYRGDKREHYMKYAVNRARDLKLACVEYKGNKCKDCGLVHVPGHNTSVFQFHHRDPSEKDFALSAAKSRAFENIKEELDKCDMLCANCHHVLHWSHKDKE